MASLNKVQLIGRLTREPEAKTFSGGGKVVRFGFAVNESKKNKDTGKWEDDAVFLEAEAWNTKSSNLADRFEECSKGTRLYLEGKLKVESWDDKAGGGKRSKVLVSVFTMQYLDAKKTTGEAQESVGEDDSAISRVIGATDDPNDLYAGTSTGSASKKGSSEIPF